MLLLIPLLILLGLLFAWPGKARFERSFTVYSDKVLAERGSRFQAGKAAASAAGAFPEGTDVAGRAFRGNGTGGTGTEGVKPAAHGTGRSRSDSLFFFDPNTIGLSGLQKLGFSEKQARVILNYRAAGAVFRRKEDFARCYTVSDAMYEKLAPYIKIEFFGKGAGPDREAAAVPSRRGEKERKEAALDSCDAGTMPVEGSGGMSGKGEDGQATERAESAGAVAAGKKKDGSGRTAGKPVELNGADSAELVAVRGIGPLTAGRIVAYRERLGGYVSAGQLQEVEGMTERNYLLILQQICVDRSKIRKIDINFAPPKRLEGHPYLPPKVLNRILKYRQLKGGWSSTGDLIEQHILSQEQAERLAPYLCFGP